MQHIECSDRVNSGSLQLGRDWPGYFLRGDEALGTAVDMRRMADAIERCDESIIKALPTYLRQMASKFETLLQVD